MDPCPGTLLSLGGQTTRACPFDLAASVHPLVDAYRWLANHGVLPLGKGWLEQTQGFVEAVAVLDSEVAEIQKARAVRRGAP